MAIAFTATADAAHYKMVLCAGNNGSNGYGTEPNTASPGNPGGSSALRTTAVRPPTPPATTHSCGSETQSAGNAGQNAYGSISWTVPGSVAIRGAGGYTRMPNAFNDGWRGRFWAEDFNGGGPHNILIQGAGLANAGITRAPTSVFAPHLWPVGGYGSYRRFVFEMTCVRAGGCDRANFNAVDAKLRPRPQ